MSFPLVHATLLVLRTQETFSAKSAIFCAYCSKNAAVMEYWRAATASAAPRVAAFGKALNLS